VCESSTLVGTLWNRPWYVSGTQSVPHNKRALALLDWPCSYWTGLLPISTREMEACSTSGGPLPHIKEKHWKQFPETLLLIMQCKCCCPVAALVSSMWELDQHQQLMYKMNYETCFLPITVHNKKFRVLLLEVWCIVAYNLGALRKLSPICSNIL